MLNGLKLNLYQGDEIIRQTASNNYDWLMQINVGPSVSDAQLKHSLRTRFRLDI